MQLNMRTQYISVYRANVVHTCISNLTWWPIVDPEAPGMSELLQNANVRFRTDVSHVSLTGVSTTASNHVTMYT